MAAVWNDRRDNKGSKYEIKPKILNKELLFTKNHGIQSLVTYTDNRLRIVTFCKNKTLNHYGFALLGGKCCAVC